VHIAWQNRYTDELIRPLARGIIRDVISQFGVEQVVTSQRDEMVKQIREALTNKLAENGLTLLDFLLRNITFSPEYSASIEQKQIAEQQAQQAKLVVESKRQEAEQARQTAQGAADAAVIRAKGDADARILQAQAEAKALELIAAALKENQELLTYQYISKLAPGIQVMLVPNDTPYLLPLPNMGSSLPQGTTYTPDTLPTPAPTPAPTTTP
jgi:regulator of protease activity HflC (stomatin/prohibitin superfamily)